MAQGRKTGGRKKGTRNRSTQATREAVAEAQEQITQILGATAFEGDAHALLIGIYKDTSLSMVLRLDAAKAAIGYEKPKLSSVDAHLEGSIGQYAAQPIPVEERHSDTVARSAGSSANGHSA